MLIDLSLPEEEVAPDILEGIGEGGALVHHLVDLPPRIALCKQQGGVTRRRPSASDVLPIEPVIPIVQLRLGDLQVAELWQRRRAHPERRPESLAQTLQLAPRCGVAPHLLLILPVPAVHRDLLMGG